MREFSVEKSMSPQKHTVVFCIDKKLSYKFLYKDKSNKDLRDNIII